MRLAVIPARGGSKRIPHKNRQDFCGQPILAYSIQAALACPVIDKVWVSTDDPDIASVAREYGAEVPFVRPATLADDYAIMKDVVQHALDHVKSTGESVSEVCLLFATAPMISVDDIARGWELLRTGTADFALSVTQFRAAPQRAQYVDEMGSLRYREPAYCEVRSQDLMPLFHDAAQFVWGTPEAFDELSITDANTIPVIVNADRVVDIDTPADWAYAESVFRACSFTQSSRAA